MKFTIPEKKKFLDSHSVEVRWGDMDALRHVNNTMYFRYMESARVAWLSKIGILLGHKNESFVLANTMCNFMIPISYPCRITVDSYITEITNSRMDIVHQFINPSDKKEIYAVGLATCVWVNLIKGKAIALPDSIKNKLKSY